MAELVLEISGLALPWFTPEWHQEEPHVYKPGSFAPILQGAAVPLWLNHMPRTEVANTRTDAFGEVTRSADDSAESINVVQEIMRGAGRVGRGLQESFVRTGLTTGFDMAEARRRGEAIAAKGAQREAAYFGIEMAMPVEKGDRQKPESLSTPRAMPRRPKRHWSRPRATIGGWRQFTPSFYGESRRGWATSTSG